MLVLLLLLLLLLMLYLQTTCEIISIDVSWIYSAEHAWVDKAEHKQHTYIQIQTLKILAGIDPRNTTGKSGPPQLNQDPQPSIDVENISGDGVC
jgi:hypothetical protein